MRAALALAALVLLAGCVSRRPALPPPPLPDMAQVAQPPPGIGSLWRPELALNYPFLDVRAHFPGDLLTVVVSESSQGKKDANTDSKAEASISANVQDFFGIPAAAARFLPRGFNNDPIVKATTARASKGKGATDRSGTLAASITVKVVAVDRNGNLYVQGDKVIGVNREKQYIVLSGIVRPEDIASDNSVLSTRLAAARIDYYGRGSVGSKQGVPLVHRLFDYVWPF